MQLQIYCRDSDKENMVYARVTPVDELIQVGFPDLNMPPVPKISGYKTVREMYEGEIEEILTHETLHHVLHTMKEFHAALYLDNLSIDSYWQGISKS